ncbi:MAG: lipoyl(octanoyl) transferase LipB [Chlorobi bacterium]|nr:lipoyl(octanoyl) transferase LipB [Chlorobiota bacterium]
MSIDIRNTGFISYEDAYEIQKKKHEELLENKRKGKECEGVVYFCEHPHVFTIGKSGDRSNLLVNEGRLKSEGIKCLRVDRGGDITYHGPGQSVVYPVLDLDVFGWGAKDYIYFLEYSVISVLKYYGIKGEVIEGKPGVWLDAGGVNERKICAAGVKISMGITMHGIALNVNTDLSYFGYINPCGFADKGVTSIRNELGKPVDMNILNMRLKDEFLNRLTV